MIDNAFFVALFSFTPLDIVSRSVLLVEFLICFANKNNLRKYNDNPHKNNNTTNQTSNDTIQCQYSHTSCNSKILRHKKHTHFSDTIGTSYQNPIKEIIKPICFIANLLRLLNSCSHPISVPVPGSDVSGTY